MSDLERTLVKSPPELWELVDQPERMEGWMSTLLGRAAEIEITEREPETKLGWRSAIAEEAAEIEVVLSEKGWGTNVEIAVARDGASTVQLEGWLEAVFEELAEPEKRPFRGIV
jgi:uncharacterized protein YndB with AHSA1/START domain